MARTKWLKGKISVILSSSLLFMTLAGCGSGVVGGLPTSTGSTGGTTGGGASVTKTVSLNWAPPDTNIDGSPVTDLAGYKIYYGTSAGHYTNSVDVGNSLSVDVADLATGATYYFAFTAYDSSGNESVYSDEVIIPL